MNEKITLWWCSVAGAKTEPCKVVESDNKRFAYTLGCPDAFDLLTPECPLVLVREIPNEARPLSPKESMERAKEREKWLARTGASHGWAGEIP